MFVALSSRTDAVQAFEKLVDEMHAAVEDHIDAVIAERNRRDAGETVPAKFAAATPDRRLDVLERMNALALRTEGTPQGANIALGVFAWTGEVDASPPKLAAAFERITRNYPNHPVVDTALEVVERLADGKPNLSLLAGLLDELARATKSKNTRIAARMTLGQVRLAAADPSGARSAFQAVLADQPAADIEKRARRYLFEIDHLQIGMVAPDFTTKSMDDLDISLASLRGKTVLLNFWASWCPACVGEIPRLRDVAARLEGKPFAMLNVSLDHTKGEAQSAIAAMNMPGVATWYFVDERNPAAELYNVYKLPAWFLLDAQGVIRAKDPFGEKLIPAIEALIGPAPAAP